MVQQKRATAEGTTRYRERFAGSVADGHFRQSQSLWLSSIGLGSYLGEADQRIDDAYRAAVRRALELGCNVFDTAANYRFQRSERNFGEALSAQFSEGAISREEVVITTKGGYLPFDNHQPRSRQEMINYLEETFIKPGVCEWNDFVQGSHCMTPGYLEHQLDQSLRNLRLEGVDVYYLHNPESQLAEVSPSEFYRRLHLAFEFLETAVESGKVSFYGTATWNGYRVPQNGPEFLSLEEVVKTARTVAGDNHHFRVVQLPVNLAMIEAFTLANQPFADRQHSFLQVASELGITVMSSASILQARLAQGLPAVVRENLKGLQTDAQRAIQFARSTPGLTTALVGMSNLSHVEENLEVAKIAPAAPDDYLKLFDASRK